MSFSKFFTTLSTTLMVALAPTVKAQEPDEIAIEGTEQAPAEGIGMVLEATSEISNEAQPSASTDVSAFLLAVAAFGSGVYQIVGGKGAVSVSPANYAKVIPKDVQVSDVAFGERLDVELPTFRIRSFLGTPRVTIPLQLRGNVGGEYNNSRWFAANWRVEVGSGFEVDSMCNASVSASFTEPVLRSGAGQTMEYRSDVLVTYIVDCKFYATRIYTMTGFVESDGSYRLKLQTPD